MSAALLGYFLAAAVGGGGVLALRDRPRRAALAGLFATLGCLVAAVAMADDASLSVGASMLQVTPYVRLFLIAGALALLVSQVAGLAHGWPRELPLATLGALGLVGVALTVGSPPAAMLTVAATGSFVVIASLEQAISMPAVRAAASGLRLAAIAGFLGLSAMAITGDDPIFVAPDVLAGAVLLMAAAVALRVGAVPFHAPVARLVERARTAALPLLVAWVPAAFVVIALGWAVALVELGAAPPIVTLIGVVGVLTIALASLVGLMDDDLVRWLGYGVIADGGFILLALAGATTATIGAGLAWLVCFALARTIMACVLLGFQGAYDARRSRELEGWLRRTPLLGIALLASLVVGYGLPGTLAWDARLALAEGTLGRPLATVLIGVALLPILAIARLAWVGIRPMSLLVAEGGSERFLMPPRPGDMAAGDVDVDGALADGVAPEAPGVAVGGPPAPEAPGGADGQRAVDTLAMTANGTAQPVTPVPTESALSRRGRAARAARAQGQSSIGFPDRSPGPAEVPAGDGGADPSAASAAGGQDAPVPPTDMGRDAPPSATEPDHAAPTPPADEGTATPGTEADPEAGAAGPADAASDASGSEAPPRAGRGSTLTGLRRAARAGSSGAGSARAGLGALPAIWALDRTLIASIATILLALAGLAVAFDLVGLGAAAGFGTAGPPAP